MQKKLLAIFIIIIFSFSSILVAFSAGNELSEDVTIISTLGMLKGDGSGITLDYVKSSPTRLQAAIMFLRLRGLEDDALAFSGIVNFADAGNVSWTGGKAIMAYLKAHQELGWVGDGINFRPTEKISAKEYYKVMLEALGYRQSKDGILGDFTWTNALDFASQLGLGKSAYITNFTVNDLAGATVESLKAKIKDEEKSLIMHLVDQGIVDSRRLSLLPTNLVSLNVLGGVVTSDTTIVITLGDGTSSKLASEASQYNVTMDSKNISVKSVKYDELTRKAVLTTTLKGLTGTVKVNGVTIDSMINLTSLKIDNVSGIDSSSKTFTVKLSEYPTITILGKRLILKKDSKELYATCIEVANTAATFAIDKIDQAKLDNGIYVVSVPADDAWINANGKTIIYPALTITAVSSISKDKTFTVVLSESPILTLTGKKLQMVKDGVLINATYSSIDYLKVTFTIDYNDRSKLTEGIYILSTPDNDNWATITGKTIGYYSSADTTNVSSAAYDINTGKLVISGTGFRGVPGANNDIDTTKLVISNGTTSYNLKSTNNVEIINATQAILVLSEEDKDMVDTLFTQNGIQNGEGGVYTLAAADGWNGSGSIADSYENPIMVSGYPVASISSAAYDCSTGTLTIVGENFKKVNGDNNDITPNRIIIYTYGGKNYSLYSGTQGADITDESNVTLVVSGRDRAELNAILTNNGTQNEAGQLYYISVYSDWNGIGSIQDTSYNPLTVSGVSQPSITGGIYNYNTGTLVLRGAGFRTIYGSKNDIAADKITISLLGGTSYTLSADSSYEVIDANTANLLLSNSDRAYVNGLLNKDGTQNSGGLQYNITVSEGWNGSGTLTDTSDHPITVTGYTNPSISNASYDYSTGILTITGGYFKAFSGNNNDVTVNKLTIVSGASRYTLTAATANADVIGNSSVDVAVAGADRVQLNSIFNRNGTIDISNNIYNLEVQADWNGSGSPADLTGNTITVNSYGMPYINDAAYDFSTGRLVLNGVNLKAISGLNNDINVTKIVIGDGVKLYTLTTATSNVDIIDSYTAAINVNGIDRAYLNWIFTSDGLANGSGHAYNISLNSGWNGSGSSLDNNANPISVINWTSPVINSAAYDYSTGKLTISADFLRAIPGLANDIEMTKITITDGALNYTLVNNIGNIEITSMTTAVVTLIGANKSSADAILAQNGIDNGQGGVYNLEVQLGWNGENVLADTVNNSITVTNVPSPTITSATYNRTTNQLVITCTNLRAIAGAANDIDATAFTVSDGVVSYKLTDNGSNVDITDRNTVVIQITAVDEAGVEGVLSAAGSQSAPGRTYNIRAEANWNLTGSLQDISNNPITVTE